MPILGFLIEHVYRSLFLRGETGFRRAHWIIKLLFLIATLTLYLKTPSITLLLYLLILTYMLGVLDKGVKWAYSVLFLSTIPSAWYALTTYLMLLLGYDNLDYYRVILVFVKTLTLSSMIIFYASILSPSTIYNFLHVIGRRKYSVIPIFTWRLIPYGLVNMVEALAITRLKREKLKYRVAPAIASIMELGDSIRESSYHKLYGEPMYKLPLKTSFLHNIVLLVAATASLIILLITIH